MLNRFEAWMLHVATALVAGSGVVYAVMKYWLRPVDEFSVVNHPWQPHLQHLHVVAAPLLVFAAGLIWRRHVADRWWSASLVPRLSGRTLALVLPLMIASGYLLQVATAPSFRRLWLWLHLATSAIWILLYLLHQLAPRRRP